MNRESPFVTDELAESLKSIRSRLPGPALPLRKRACNDCAVKCGFYTIYSEALKLTDQEEQLRFSRQWFCHQTPNLACRGNSDHLGISHLIDADR